MILEVIIYLNSNDLFVFGMETYNCDTSKGDMPLHLDSLRNYPRNLLLKLHHYDERCSCRVIYLRILTEYSPSNGYGYSLIPF